MEETFKEACANRTIPGAVLLAIDREGRTIQLAVIFIIDIARGLQVRGSVWATFAERCGIGGGAAKGRGALDSILHKAHDIHCGDAVR